MSNKYITVWMEGSKSSDGHCKASKIGECYANTFQEACDILCSKLPDYNRIKLTIWGCRLFDNEADARKSFG